MLRHPIAELSSPRAAKLFCRRYARASFPASSHPANGSSRRSCAKVEGDAFFAAGSLDSEGETRYAATNGRFHALIVEAAHNLAVSTALALNDKLPFVAPGTVVFDKTAQERQFMMLSYAHRQHHAIVGALVNGEGVRVEALMKEHTHIFEGEPESPGRPPAPERRQGRG
ncbi:FCD domain-containing protein [Paraburkholderia sp. JHI2823]|uniref:FCD domain-containing protein n=1 Tax=Paraburkholderia sp. JHI2823 TaxID=3112960 RepID=UPI00317500EE